MTPAVSDDMVERGAAAIKDLWAKNPTGPMTPMAMSRAALSAALPQPVGVDGTLVEAHALLTELETWHANDAGDRAIRLLRRLVVTEGR